MDVVGGFVDAENFAVHGDEDCAVWRSGKFDDEFGWERVSVLENDFGKDFAAHTFLLPAGREFSAARDFFGEARRKALGFFALAVDVRADDFFFGSANGDVDVN